VTAIAEGLGGGVAAATEGYGPLLGGQEKLLADVVGHPQPHRIVRGQFNDQRAMFAASDRDA
jgi:hypothetical protein